MEYHTGIYSKLYSTDLGQEIWQFLTKEENLIRMETASDVGKPAVEGVIRQLGGAFGDKLNDLRIKQMIGHMIRQIMENDGYRLDAQNVKVSKGILFNKSSRYVKD